jgi:hypothetical protein
VYPKTPGRVNAASLSRTPWVIRALLCSDDATMLPFGNLLPCCTARTACNPTIVAPQLRRHINQVVAITRSLIDSLAHSLTNSVISMSLQCSSVSHACMLCSVCDRAVLSVSLNAYQSVASAASARNTKKAIASRGFDPPTSGLWARRASAAPQS